MLATCAPNFLRCSSCRTVLEDGRPCGVCRPGAPRRRPPKRSRNRRQLVRLGSTGQQGRLLGVWRQPGGLEVALVDWDDGTKTETPLWLVVIG